MRRISEWVDFQRKQAQELYPSYGTLGIGGAGFDYLLKAVVGESYLRVLRHGGTNDEAYLQAVLDGNDCVQNWNKNGRRSRVCIGSSYELERWDNAGAVEADALHGWFLALVESP